MLIYGGILIFTFSFIILLFKDSYAHKFNKFEKIIILSDEIDCEVDFYNVDKVGQDIIYMEHKKVKLFPLIILKSF